MLSIRKFARSLWPTPPALQVFGYGSLVCKQSRPPHLKAVAASVTGWQRIWAHRIRTTHKGMTDLTVVADPQTTIAGIALQATQAQHKALDRRESGYQEVSVQLEDGSQAVLYATHEKHLQAPDEDFPVWLSYLDAVLQGYYQLGGSAAVAELIKTTADWGFPVYDDAAAPEHLKAADFNQYDAALVAAIKTKFPAIQHLRKVK
jgi:glutathione-specific gamma-glutamylcyclotransferase